MSPWLPRALASTRLPEQRQAQSGQKYKCKSPLTMDQFHSLNRKTHDRTPRDAPPTVRMGLWG